MPRLREACTSLPSPQPSPGGRGSHLKRHFESPLPLGEGQGEGHSCYDSGAIMTIETACSTHGYSGYAPLGLLMALGDTNRRVVPLAGTT